MYFVPEKHKVIKHSILQFGVGCVGGLNRQWNATLKCRAASFHYCGNIQSVFLILSITEICRVHNGVEYTDVSVINNVYLEEMDLVLATT